MHLWFNTGNTVFKFDPSLEGVIWYKQGATRLFYNDYIIPCSYKTSEEPEVNLDKIQFGDGYEQVTEAGLNPIRRMFQVRFANIRRVTAVAIRRFLQGEGIGSIYYRRPSEWFLWAPPYPLAGTMDQPLRVRCEKWNVAVDEFDAVSVNATFQETFEP